MIGNLRIIHDGLTPDAVAGRVTGGEIKYL